jgi:hypothetical protein
MSLALLEWRLRRHRGFGARCRSNWPSLVAHPAQSKKKRISLLSRKSGFFLPQTMIAPENRLFSGATYQI